jgi:hypothetical protein
VKVIEHDPPLKTHVAPSEYAPVPPLQVMEPVGVVLLSLVSDTVAVQVIGALTGSLYGGQVTTVFVLSGGGVQVMVTCGVPVVSVLAEPPVGTRLEPPPPPPPPPVVKVEKS